MIRFRPAVESLGERALPSAVLTRLEVPTAAVAKPAVAAEAPAPNYLRITLSDILISSYSTSSSS